MRELTNFIIILSAMLGWSSCTTPDRENKIMFSGEAQGTYYAITYFGDDTVVEKHEVDSLLTAFDRSVSVWVPESIISNINSNDPENTPDE